VLAGQLEATARRLRPVPEPEAAEAQRRRSLRWCAGPRSPGLPGAPDPATGLFEAYESRAADALVQLASERLGAEAEPDRACVVVHLDGAVLGGQAGAPPDAGAAHLEDGPALAVSSARRLACDARVQTIWDGADGQPMGVGRATRQVPAWLLRQLRRRDEGCVFPGCGRTRWVHAHHLVHWADGGATDADNLALLCGFHHRVVHQPGWAVSGHPAGRLRFTRPDGRSVEGGPPGLRREVQSRFDVLLPASLRPPPAPAFSDTS
jgi:hypothetical protein